MHIKTYKTRKEEERKIQFIELDPSLFVFKVTTTIHTFDENNKKIETKRYFDDGLIEKSQIDLMLKDQHYKSKDAYICSDQFIQEVKKTNFFDASKNFKPKKDNYSQKVFDKIKSGKFVQDNIYYLDSDYIFRDWKGNIIPHSIPLNISNEDFDIEKTAEYLLKKENIIFPVKKDKSKLTAKDIIEEDSYREEFINADGEEEIIKYIPFIWQPSDIQFDLFVQKARNTYQNGFELQYRKVIHQMDLLGFKRNNLIINKEYDG